MNLAINLRRGGNGNEKGNGMGEMEWGKGKGREGEMKMKNEMIKSFPITFESLRKIIEIPPFGHPDWFFQPSWFFQPNWFFQPDWFGGGGNKRFELLYDAQRDGYSNKVFHEKCDNKGATVTLIKLKNGHIFGGYAATSWESVIDGKWKAGPGSFIFTLTDGKGRNPAKFDLKNQNDPYAILCHPSYCPIFGGNGTFSHFFFPLFSFFLFFFSFLFSLSFSFLYFMRQLSFFFFFFFFFLFSCLCTPLFLFFFFL